MAEQVPVLDECQVEADTRWVQLGCISNVGFVNESDFPWENIDGNYFGLDLQIWGEEDFQERDVLRKLSRKM